uniref:Uncharacterized protein n=1 Tax=Corethron hystrix TaxID=216773 RepID=A0A7S1BII9_9STRA|mmetsp:Transcript_28440/g.65066  ORF Transcript_28440/g.65066 Transcript_28440/m.65066 type:complete len:107 (+) Transcript_28440:264-584(+)
MNRLHSEQSNLPFIQRKVFGTKGQHVLQVGVGVGVLVAFVGLPLLRNHFFNKENMRQSYKMTQEFYVAKQQLHIDRFEHELELRRRAIAGTLGQDDAVGVNRSDIP